MKSSLRQRIFKLIGIFSFLFIVLFLFRIGYGYTLNITDGYEENSMMQLANSHRNYATKKYKSSPTSSSIPVNQHLDQKYEKVAQIITKSASFEEEENKARASIERYNALIQNEQKKGNDGNRYLSLAIGVPPDNFDSLYNSLIKIGNIQAKEITKKDKTNEYKELNAKKASLEKIRTSLIDLKSKGGKIEEYMQLENRILEIDQQLQELGVNLGDFDDENEFCTVMFSLKEGKERSISFMHRIKVALEWTLEFYFYAIATLFFISGVSFFLLLIIDKLKLFDKLVSSNKE